MRILILEIGSTTTLATMVDGVSEACDAQGPLTASSRAPLKTLSQAPLDASSQAFRRGFVYRNNRNTRGRPKAPPIPGCGPRLQGQGMALTTVSEGDVMLGVEKAIRMLGGGQAWDDVFATSSAAGGLRMTVHGLVYEMTARAAKEAALGAGAIVELVTAGLVTPTDFERLLMLRPSIVMISGGVDFGERSTTLKNVRKVSSLLGRRLPGCPVIFAGNAALQEEVRSLFQRSGVLGRVVENVYPRVDELNVEPARAAIQEVFEEHITGAPGMEKVKELVRRKLMPTPGAVMNACKLLYGEIGDLMVVDVGGATTDVHSVTAGGGDDAPGVSNTEPLAKRTVEGDLGIYANRESLIREVGWMELSKELGFDVRPVSGSMGPIPSSSEELALSVRLTFEAARIALDRHAGRVKLRCGAGGPVRVPLGRDLSRVKWIIGTGGALVRLPGGREALEQLKATGGGPRSGSGRPGSLGTGGWDPAEERMLPSEEARVVLDGDYIMAQAGVLAARFPGAALSLLRASLGL